MTSDAFTAWQLLTPFQRRVYNSLPIKEFRTIATIMFLLDLAPGKWDEVAYTLDQLVVNGLAEKQNEYQPASVSQKYKIKGVKY